MNRAFWSSGRENASTSLSLCIRRRPSLTLNGLYTYGSSHQMCSMAGIREASSVTCCEIHAGLWTGPWALAGTTVIGELRSICWQVQHPWNRTDFLANLEQRVLLRRLKDTEFCRAFSGSLSRLCMRIVFSVVSCICLFPEPLVISCSDYPPFVVTWSDPSLSHSVTLILVRSLRTIHR